MSFFTELKQRKVVRVATGYLVAAWIAIQAASIALPAFDAPSWTLRIFILLFVLGFPLALMLSWALDVTPDGIQPTRRRKGDKLMAGLFVALMALAIGWYYFGQPAYRTDKVSRPVASSPPERPSDSLQANPEATTADQAARTAPSSHDAATAHVAAPTPAAPALQSAPQPDVRPPAPIIASTVPPTASARPHPTRTQCADLIRKVRTAARSDTAQRSLSAMQRKRIAMTKLRDAGCLDDAMREARRR